MNGFYFITDALTSRAGNINDVKNAVAAGVETVQYREKHKSAKDMCAEAMELRKICKNITFLVNDRVDVALSVNADGVHLGGDDLPYPAARKLLGKNKLIGLTAHNLKEAKEAEKMGADYIGVSPIFKTATKPDAGKPAGIKLIKEVKKSVSIPVIAIGGINLFNAPEVIRAGADGLAAIAAVVTKPDVKKSIREFQSLFRKRA